LSDLVTYANCKILYYDEIKHTRTHTRTHAHTHTRTHTHTQFE